MNSEISNISKLSPVTVVKAEKKTEQRQSSTSPEALQTLSTKMTSVNKENAEVLAPTVKTEEDKSEAKLSLDVVKKAADEGNSLLQSVKRNLQFTVDDSTKEVVVKIVDSDSGELVRQIPSEEMLAFIAKLQELNGEGHLGNMLQERA